MCCCVTRTTVGFAVYIWILINSGICSENVALHKPASMSPHGGKVALDASSAVDGESSSDSILRHEVCVHSLVGDPKPWVVVDLLKEYYISHIFLINRLDCCQYLYILTTIACLLEGRTHDFIIDVFKTNPARCDSAKGSVCITYDGAMGNQENLTCDTTVLGRFVRIWKPIVNYYNDVLNICEMEVFGRVKDPECGLAFIPVSGAGGKRLVSNKVTTVPVLSKSACFVKCKMFGACVGGNYNTEHGTCELHTRPEYSATVSTDPDWVYFGHDLC